MSKREVITLSKNISVTIRDIWNKKYIDINNNELKKNLSFVMNLNATEEEINKKIEEKLPQVLIDNRVLLTDRIMKIENKFIKNF